MQDELFLSIVRFGYELLLVGLLWRHWEAWRSVKIAFENPQNKAHVHFW